MENEEMLEQTNETENVDTQTTEEFAEGIELTDTTDTTENEEKIVEEKKEVKTFTQEEVDKIVRKRLARQEKDYQKELSKYKNVENVLNVGLGTSNIDEADSKLREYYKEQGLNIPEPTKPGLSDRELQILGEAEADEILELGLTEAENEANRLAQKGHNNWNIRERATFNKLVQFLNREKKKQELTSIGVDANILDSEKFKEFASQFTPSASIKNIYNLYSNQGNKKEEKEKIGSVKNDKSNGLKDFYTYEDSLKYSKEDFDKNPELFKRVCDSMSKW